MINRPILPPAPTVMFPRMAQAGVLIAMLVVMLTRSALAADINSTVVPSVGSATSCFASGGAMVCNKPPSTVAGHLLVFCGYGTASGTLTLPSGFTPIITESDGNGISSCSYKVAGSSEPSTYTISTGITFADAILVDVANVGSSSIDSSSGSIASLSIPAPVTTNSRDLILVFAHNHVGQTVTGATLITQATNGYYSSAFYYAAPSMTATISGSSSSHTRGEQIAIAPLQVSTGNNIATGAIQGFPTGFSADVAAGTPTYSIAANPQTGYGAQGCFNPVAYGADPTGSRDSSPGLNAAVAPACAAQGTICLPAGNYHLDSQPWLVYCPSGYLPNVVGAGKIATTIVNRLGGGAGGGGPAIELASAQTLSDYGGSGTIIQPALVGTGNSWSTDNKQMLFDLNYPLNSLNPLNGLSAFTVETCFSTTTNSATEVLAASDGAAAPYATGCNYYGPPTYSANPSYTCKGAFWFGLADNGELYGAMNIGGTWSGLMHSAAAVGTNTTVCAQMSYDGANIRLFHGAPNTTMTEDAKVAATGTVTERQDEDLTMLMQPLYWHLQDPQYFWQGQVDTFRISKVARCTNDAGCTAPNAKLTGDSNTVFLENWDQLTLNLPNGGTESSLPLVGVDYTNGGANTPGPQTQSWMVMDNENAGNPQDNHPEIKNLSVVGGSGPEYHVNANAPQFINLEAGDPSLGGDNWGFMVSNYGSYGVTGYNLWGRGTVPAIFNGGLSYLYGLNMQCSLTCGEYAGPVVSGLQILTGSTVKWGIVLPGWTHLDSFYDDAENGGTYPAALIANMNQPTGPATTFTNSVFLQEGNAPDIQLDGQTFNTTITNSLFETLTGGAVSYVDDSHASGASHVEFDNDLFYGGGVGSACPPSGTTFTASTVADWQALGGCTTTKVTLNGTTAGHAYSSEPTISSNRKVFDVYLNGYENTSATPQTVTLPVAFATTISSVSAVTGNCAGVTATTSTVTMPSSMGTTQTGLCEFYGY